MNNDDIHPNAPAGGGGPGNFRGAGPLGTNSKIEKSMLPGPLGFGHKIAGDKTLAVKYCNPKWFEKAKSYSVSKPTSAAKTLTFTGDDLNFLARMLYAEATGSGACPDANERKNEKTAILHVCYFRMGRKGYPSNTYIAKTFTDVVKAPGQFESVFKSNKKLDNSAESVCKSLGAKECADLDEALDAVNGFLSTGPDFKTYPFDKFLASTGRSGWVKYGGNEFSLFPAMNDAMAKEIGS
jgi:hypothetical protein